MAENDDWYPRRRAEQRAMYDNFRKKIANYDGVIEGVTHDVRDRFILICDTYIAIYDGVQADEATINDLHEWQRDFERGDKSEPVQASPAFQTITLPAGAFKGFVKEFRDKVGLLKKSAGYTQAIGEDLMIVAQKTAPLAPESLIPQFTYQVRAGYRVGVAGKMQGMHAVKFYYRRKGETEWVFVGFLTKMPGEIHIQPVVAGQPETGDLRAQFSDDNQDVGQLSQSQEVTLS